MSRVTATTTSIVVIEDEAQIRRHIRMTLESEGFTVVESGTALDGICAIKAHDPALVVLDLGLPDRDGVDVVRDLRGWSSVPILILSARTRERDKVAALDAGADDFLTKPFGVEELLARVRALLRRTRLPDGEATCVHFGDVNIDLIGRMVTKGGVRIHLTPIEYRLLVHLVANAGRVITHRQLLRAVWGPGHADRTHYLRVYMAGLRHKLEANPNIPQYLLTEPGVGYRLWAAP